MRKEWISCLNFNTKRTEQKIEKTHQRHKERWQYVMKNSSHLHFHNFYGKLYKNWLSTRKVAQYLL